LAGNKIKEITKEEAYKIISNIKPVGKYLIHELNTWAALEVINDNTFVENFTTKSAAIAWLNGELEEF
jgi:hypothetical protein